MIPPTFDEPFARALVEAGPDALVVCDAEGRIALVNGLAERLFDYAPGELLGENIEILLPERFRDGHIGKRTRYLVAPHSRPMGAVRLVARRRDGGEFPVDISLSPVRTSEQLFVAAAVRDVTVQDRMEKALAAAEAELRETIEQSPEGILISDLTGRFQQVNGTVCRLLGYTREELLAMSPMDLVAPEQLPELLASRARLDKRGIVEVGEWRVRRKDGTYTEVEVTAKIDAADRWHGMMRDVSERKLLERERDAASARLRTVLEQCPVGIGLLGVGDGEVRLELNQRGLELMQRSAEEVNGEAYLSFFAHPDGSPLRVEELPSRRALSGERVEPTELLVTRSDGSRLPIQVRGAPLCDRSGGVVGGIIAFEDITAEKDLERLRTEWNAIVAHDLRNPLNAIVLHARLLARLTKDNPVVVESLDEIQTAAGRMNRMIHDLLDISRLEAHKLTLTRVPLRLDAVVQAAVNRASLAAPDRPFEIRAADDLPSVLADPDRVAQVLDNLLSNAIKYGQAGTPVAVSIAPAGNAVAVTVANQGPPLAQEALDQLFQRFYRVADRRLQGVKGIGLGLYIARELVEAHGGRMTAESTPEGRTTFRFTLPVA